MRRLLLLTLLALSCFWVAPSGFAGAPASAACKAPGSLAGDLKQADVVFTGTVRTVEKDAAGAPTTYIVVVSRVYHGRVESEVTVLTPAAAADCGLQGVKPGSEWLFAGTSAPQGVIVESDEGSREATAAVTRKVRQVLGAGKDPVQVDSSVPPVSPTLTRVADEGPTGFWPLAMPGAVVVVAGLVVLAVTRAMSRPKVA